MLSYSPMCNMNLYSAICRIMLQYTAIWSSMFQYAPICGSMFPYSLICGRMSKYALIRKLLPKTLQYAELLSSSQHFDPNCCSMLQHTQLCCTSLSSTEQMLWYVLIINQREALIFQIYFWNRTLHVADSISVHHQEYTVHHQEYSAHTAIGIGHIGYADCLLAESGSRCTALWMSKKAQICISMLQYVTFKYTHTCPNKHHCTQISIRCPRMHQYAPVVEFRLQTPVDNTSLSVPS